MRRGVLQQVSKVGVIPAPTGGWNARDPLADLAPNDAVILDNFIPGTGGVSLRAGTTTWATGLGASVQSLLQYYGPSAAPKLFGAAGTSIFDVSTAGAVGAAVVTGLTTAYLQSLMFSTPGGSFLVACNGVDPVRNYDGTTWTEPTITPDLATTGATSFINLASAANRLWFVEKNSLRAWYLDVQAVAGAAHVFDLGAAGSTRGGHLVAIAQWTQDGGAGPNALTLFITSRGEIFMYSGTDPSIASSWSIVGVFRIPPPIGYRCILQAGADLAINTIQGVVPLSSILALDPAASGRVAFTDKIRGAFIAAATAASLSSGWEMVDYPAGEISIVNVPTGTAGLYYQFVMNNITGAWCRFLGINAVCWAMFGDDLYYGKEDGTVHQYDTGHDDDGAVISGIMMPAFSQFGDATQKQFLMAQPLYNGAYGSNPPLVCKTDYDTSVSSPTQPTPPPLAGTPWGSAWNSPWTPALVVIAQWQGISGLGRAATVQLCVALRTGLVLQQTLVLFASCENILGG